MAKKVQTVTCGVIVTDGNNYLICHPTFGKWWDLPKGQRDEGETFSEAAVRELYEETGMVVTQDQLQYIGLFDYKSSKQLALFYLKIDTLINVKDLHCTSTFNLKGKQIPEMDSYKLVSKKVMLEKVNPSMQKVLTAILNND